MLVHGSSTTSPRSAIASRSTAVSVGYLCPTLEPSNPASAISLMHCSKPMPMSMPGKSSFHHRVGVTPSRTFSRSNWTGAFI